MGTRLLPFALLAAAFGCTPGPATPTAFCEQDSDCNGLACVADLTLGVSYCSTVCARDSDCPAHQQCRTGVDFAGSGAATSRYCVDRVRSCGPELCNGLDDDCDGVIDGPSCAPIRDCLDDAPCGAFVCSAPENQPSAICMPPISPAPVADFSVCTAGSQCENGLCESGVCAPTCRLAGPDGSCPRGAQCCPASYTCARGLGGDAVPAHNLCQKVCNSPGDCPAPQACVWRDVYQGATAHEFVCAVPPPQKKPLGATCGGPGGDAECQSGLCYDCRCRRPCDQGDPCSDGGPGATCQEVTLLYGQLFNVSICLSTEACAR